MSQSREDLIHSLASSMGMGESQKAHISSSKYNMDTGVMYCNGHVINKNQIEQARIYFTTQYRKLAEKDDEGAKELSTMYEVAMEAITMMTGVENGN